MRRRLLIVFAAVLFLSSGTFAQHITVKGLVKDRQSDEHLPFASIISKNTGIGGLTDSSGIFSLSIPGGKQDTLLVTCVGYRPLAIPLFRISDSSFLTIQMDVAPAAGNAVVKVKFNRALWLWNKVEKNKHKYDRSTYKNYSYELYNKLELDLANISREKLANRKVLKPFNFILDYIDTSEAVPYLPVFLTETISNYYFQHSPKKVKEIIKASKTNGVDNESVTKLLGGTYQNVNVYSNYIPVFDKDFVSPFHDNGDNYYNFKLLDTQYISNRRFVHMSFTPKRKGENTFNGDCWIHDSTFAIQKITLRPSGDANINFVKDLTLIQEFKMLNDTTWFLGKDKFVVDLALLGNTKGSFKGRKTTTYRNIVINSDSTADILSENRKPEEVKVIANSEYKTEAYWDSSRHEQLSKNEKGIYKMIDTIQSVPAFKKYSNTINFLVTGYKNIGNYQIGPWQNWISGNAYEGTRVRFDLGTNTGFSRKFYLHGYAAYGFTDKQYKGFGEVFYLPKKDPRLYLYASYTKDLDNGQRYYDEVTTDNIFSLAIQKPGIHPKYQMLEEKRFELFKEFKSGLSYLLTATSSQYDPVYNLPEKFYFNKNIQGEALNNFETAIRIRYAYLETFLENNFFRTSLGSDYPIVELKYSKGWAGVLKSSYNYHKINISVSDYLKVPPVGNIYYNVFAGKIFGTLPYSLLEVHPGNNIYYYNKYAFNMMNRFEFISDRYAGFNVEHNIGNGMFRWIPITRKLKFRQFYSAKGVWGDLSDANKNLNFVGAHTFQSLDKKMYLEAGTGVDNILKVLRFDFIWRILPQPLPAEKSSRFGIFGSFRLAF